MSVLTREDLMSKIQGRIGEDRSDETIAFLEDITDTFNDLESKAKGDGEDWKSKYEENDKMWKEKYTSRFFSTDKSIIEKLDGSVKEPVIEEEETATSFDDLFIESEV